MGSKVVMLSVQEERKKYMYTHTGNPENVS